MTYIKFDAELRHITDISVGIYADAQGFSISVVGIEEQELPIKPFEKYKKFAYRYWLLDQIYNSKISHVQIRNASDNIAQKYKYIDNINTNEKTLLPILKDIATANLMDLSEDNLITLIKSLNNDNKLEIISSRKEIIVPILEKYEPEEINYVAISLYLGLNYKIDKVINSHPFLKEYA
jgi:hypothetical protein